MSRLAVQRYQNEIAQLIHYGGTSKESSIRRAFEKLLDEYCRQKDFVLVSELAYKTAKGTSVNPDGTVKDALRLSWGYWEAKDTNDDLDEEIQKKFAKGYPQDNILFEDSHTLVLIQGGSEAGRVALDDDAATDRVLLQFLNYERPEVRTFRKAIEQFRYDLPGVVGKLREAIEKAEKSNAKFKARLADFVALGQASINPDFGAAEAREMMIQHILTEDIFNRVFGETQFHHENNIAHELEQVINTFFTGPTRRDTLERIRPFFDVINAQASGIASHKEKQKFLKVVYENFYQAYNPKGADRLGIVYTPNEVVRFMIESTDYLVSTHFDKTLADKGVEILDPATGTGTFVTELLEYLPKQALAHKYRHELYANEVAILPYYIANLNIEYTYKQKMGEYVSFENICFMDTLDNVLQRTRGTQLGFSFGLGMENAQRIRRQNEREISVIIGNPPYNANQQNENDNNKNRTYPDVDRRIKNTYLLRSTAQKTKVYDMYARFFRWASDRLADRGILAFITNSSFIHSRTFDGFRKAVADEFSDIYLVDLGGDVRANPKLSGTKHNVFGIQTGVAMAFFVKQPKRKNQLAKIRYASRPPLETAADKLTYLHETDFKELDFERIKPDAKGNWLGQTDNDWESLVPLIDSDTRSTKHAAGEKSLFRHYAGAIKTNRDEWVYDHDRKALIDKVKFFVKIYTSELKRWQSSKRKEVDSFVDTSIKWSSGLKSYLISGGVLTLSEGKVTKSLYRPFSKLFYFYEPELSDRLTQQHAQIWKSNLDTKNQCICFTGTSAMKPFQAFSVDGPVDYDCFEKTQCVPIHYYNKNGDKQPNITAWGLAQFRTHYGDAGISGEDIFHYAYAVLHDPHYRAAYAQNLKQDFPRLPFYPGFAAWVAAGRELMHLHLNFEKAEQHPVVIRTSGNQRKPAETSGNQRKPAETSGNQRKPAETSGNQRKPAETSKPRLKADPATGTIILTDDDIITGIPADAWRYRLGNRSALEWVLDQYKERTPKDPTIRAQFNTYRYADHADEVRDLLARVCTVSVETMRLVDALAAQSPLRPGA